MKRSDKDKLSRLPSVLAFVSDAIDWGRTVEQIRRFEAGYPEQLRTLALHGWFISSYMPINAIYPLASLFQSGRLEEGHQALCLHYNKELPGIESELARNFLKRAIILKKAFSAHRKGDFELSIPVLLAQADGIARDIIAKEMKRFSVYSRRNKFRNTIQSFINECEKKNLLISELLKVAVIDMPLNVSEGDPMLTAEMLNRNEILHGTNTSYATPLNSYRAISWLEYVSHFRWIREMSAN
jgi:hypothetical protein